MGKGVTIKVENNKAVFAELNKYGKNSNKTILKEALVSAFTIESKAKVRVPKDESRLATSIMSRKTKEGAKVSTNVIYGPYIEFTKPEGTGPHGGPRPYLMNSFKEEIPKFISRVKRALKK